MARMGYTAEYFVKKKLQKDHGEMNVVKVAIAQQGGDFIVLFDGKVLKIVEVKSTVSPIYYPSEKHRKQFHRILDFCIAHHCDFELWIKTVKEWKIISFERDFYDYPECRRFIDDVSAITPTEVRLRTDA